ncbi:MAG TPA: CheR family methyltransferase [Gemmatimonadales bacterium]|nr:CheR family methyltransferase [Gemmatimonadales bacterium]
MATFANRAAVTAAIDRLTAWTGLAFPASRHAFVMRVLDEAMTAAGVADPALFLEQLQSDRVRREALIAELTVGETYFFRDPGQFELLRRKILPERIYRRHGVGLRLWSAGCASGEEAYSLAILLREMGLAASAQIVGTDLAEHRLARARRGRYGRWSLRAMPDGYTARYFRRNGSRFHLIPEIRHAVEFTYCNLADGPAAMRAAGIYDMDVVLCRNVLIYVDAPQLAAVAAALLNALNHDGWLLLGAADPPLSGLVPCESVVTEAGVAYRRAQAATQPAMPAPPLPITPVVTPRRVEPMRQPAGDRRSAEPQPVNPPAAPIAAQVRALADAGRLDEAGRACAAALETDPTSAELVCLQAQLLGEAGRDREAAIAAQQALYLDRRLVPGHLTLGCALSRAGDVSGARRAFRNAEALVTALPESDPVPGTGGQPPAALQALIRTQLQLLDRAR